MEMDGNGSETQTAYSLSMRGWYGVIRAVIGFLFWLLTRLEVRGKEHVPDKGPYLLATNHLHWLDTGVLMVAFPHRSHVFAGEKWAKHWLLGPLFRLVDAIFVQRGEVDRQALRRALAVLQGGGVLGMAPEGTRSKTGALQRGRMGAAYLAIRAAVKVVPVVVTGQAEVFPSLRRLRRARLRVVFGPPFEPPPIPAGGKASAAQAQAFTEEIMYRFAALLPPRYRGVYQDVAERRPDLLALYATETQSSLNEEPRHEPTRE